MARINDRALALVDEVALAQRGLVTSAQLQEIGFTRSTIQRRSRQGGPWRRLLPGVHLVARGEVTEDQRVLAATLYVGEPCLVTAGAALRRAGVAAARDIGPGEVHVLVPHERRRASTHFVHVQRARHWPDDDGEVPPGASLVRAALDACRTLSRRSDVAALLAEIVRDGRSSIDEIRAERFRLQRRRSALIGDVLTSLEAGVVSGPEDELFRLWRHSDLPHAVWNAELYIGGEFIARPDVYLPEHGVLVEVDSAAHHWSRDDWERTMRRHARVTARGLVALHVSPRRLWDDWDGVHAEVLGAIQAQEGRSLPEIRVVLWTDPRERGG